MLPQQIMCIFHPVVYCKLPIVMDRSSIFYVLAALSPEFSIVLVSIQQRAFDTTLQRVSFCSRIIKGLH